jgi:hypothetical protein
VVIRNTHIPLPLSQDPAARSDRAGTRPTRAAHDREQSDCARWYTGLFRGKHSRSLSVAANAETDAARCRPRYRPRETDPSPLLDSQPTPLTYPGGRAWYAPPPHTRPAPERQRCRVREVHTNAAAGPRLHRPQALAVRTAAARHAHGHRGAPCRLRTAPAMRTAIGVPPAAAGRIPTPGLTPVCRPYRQRP